MNYTFDNADRPSTAADGSNGITYAAGFKASPGSTCAANVTCYTPQGTFYALSIGQTASFNGVNLTHVYNNRLQPQEFKASSTAGNAIDVTYSYADPLNGNYNAGHVFSITNNLDGTRSQTFTLDQLNRITSAQTTSTFSTSPAHCWGETYTVDAWGNLQSIAATTNSAYDGCVQESGFTKTADSNNHLSGFSYDAAGSTTNDGTFGYTWDGESQLKIANGITYAYDGDGRRVSKSNGKLYWYGSGGEILAETDASGNNATEYIFFGGKRVAMIAPASNPIYYVEDMLGTSRVITTNTGAVCYDADFYPFGGERAYTNTCPQNYKFEGKERDSESGLDNFGARYYSNRFGRWLSADWSAIPAPVPYANLTNPQTLNLYSMVADDPESFADLDGHWQCEWCQKLKHWAKGDGWRTDQEVKDTAAAFRKSVSEVESVSLYNVDTGKLETFSHDQISKMSDSNAVQLKDRIDQSGDADEETLAKVAGLTGQAIAVGTAVLPNANPSWGRNRLIKELHDRDFVMTGQTRGDGGIIYKNFKTGEEIRIMPRPQRAPFRNEPSAKFHK